MICDLQLAHLVDVGAQQLGLQGKRIDSIRRNPNQPGDSPTYALDVVVDVNLLVLGVCTIVASAHRHQDHILAGGLLQSKSNWNGTALACHVGLHIEDMLHGTLGGLVMRMIGILSPGFAGREHGDLQLVGGTTLGPLLVNVLDNALLNVLGILIRHQANGELADDLLWYDSLGSGLVEGALNAVNGQAGITPSGLQQPGLVPLVRQIIGAYVFPKRERERGRGISI